MPELPEVETTRRGIAPHLLNQTIERVIVRQAQLRWPVPDNLDSLARGQRILSVERRGKYILVGLPAGTLILHLGMSGSLRVITGTSHPSKHEHFDIVMANEACLRFRDPRRFGALLWTPANPLDHPLLKPLGPEPFSQDFSGGYLFETGQGRKVPVKPFIMNSHIVAGVGNIYANESLFRAEIHPARSAGRISKKRFERLADCIRGVLGDAIDCGGTTLRNFVNESGNPGYFQQTLSVYDRNDLPCRVCGAQIRVKRLGQRSTFYCPKCQH